MAVDYQVVAFTDLAPVSGVRLYSSNPRSLDIRGSDFRGVDSVLINGVNSPEFVVLGPSRIVAQVPDKEIRNAIQQVDVLLTRNGLTRTTDVDLRAVNPGARASGFTRLLQSFLRLLFTNPGEDFSDPELGGGLFVVVGSSQSEAELKAAAARAIGTTERQMLGLQSRNPSLSSPERLRSATLLQAEFVPETSSLNIRLKLTAMDGTTGSPVVSV